MKIPGFHAFSSPESNDKTMGSEDENVWSLEPSLLKQDGGKRCLTD